MPSVGGRILAPCRVGSGNLDSAMCFGEYVRLLPMTPLPLAPRKQDRQGHHGQSQPLTLTVGRPSRGPWATFKMLSWPQGSPRLPHQVRAWTPACPDAEPELRAGWE